MLGEWRPIALERVAKGREVFSVVTGAGTFDFDYYLEVIWPCGTIARYPEAAPEVPRSVVIATTLLRFPELKRGPNGEFAHLTASSRTERRVRAPNAKFAHLTPSSGARTRR